VPIREAGHKRALEFSDEHVMMLWSAVLAGVSEKRRVAGA
jgi:hypothetical protein